MASRIRRLRNRIVFAGPVLRQLLRWILFGKGEGCIYFGTTQSSAMDRADPLMAWHIQMAPNSSLHPEPVE